VIIAEIGSNFRNLDDCLYSIETAKRAGADFAKFQAFTGDALYGPGHGPIAQELDLEWLPALKRKADECEIGLMCTAFSPELVTAVDPFVQVHKVASSDANYPQLLRTVAATGKPVIMSLGAARVEDVQRAIDILGKQVVLLSCIAAYPADCMSPRGAPGVAGISDHTLGYSVAVEAAMSGALVIEKHFTAFPDLDTPDREHSLTPAQFTRMVKLIRHQPVESEENAMFLRHKRRLIATQDISTDALFNYGVNFGAYRSLEDDTRGLSPFAWEQVQGKKARLEIKRGKPIGLGDFE
jgi:sialic acid synthase SpsE